MLGQVLPFLVVLVFSAPVGAPAYWAAVPRELRNAIKAQFAVSRIEVTNAAPEGQVSRRGGAVLTLQADAVRANGFRVVQANTKSPRFHVWDFARVERRSPWWGFDGVLLTGDLGKVFNLSEPGLLVQRVVEKSPAEKLGLRGGFMKATFGDRTLTVGGDVILRVQGMPCTETHRVYDALAELKPGERLTVTVMRQGQQVELSMVVP